MAAKQSIIDSIHASLRATSASLGQSQVRLKQLQSAKKERDERIQKIRNLRNAADEEGYRLQQLKEQQGADDGADDEDMYLGQPDVSLFPLSMPPVSSADSPKPSAALKASLADNPGLLSTLPKAKVVKTRIRAYHAINADLERGVGELKTRSRDVEGKYRRVIALCTKTPEENVDDVLVGLVKAVESEGGDVEVKRLQEFLGRVEGGVE